MNLAGLKAHFPLQEFVLLTLVTPATEPPLTWLVIQQDSLSCGSLPSENMRPSSGVKIWFKLEKSSS